MTLDQGEEDVTGNVALDAQNGRLRMTALDKSGIQATGRVS